MASENQEVSSKMMMHIVMYPWYGLSHLTSFLRLANNLAQRGHKVSFFLPTKTQPKLAQHNHHPDLITFFPITVPHVDGLPLGAETPRDVPVEGRALLRVALDQTHDILDSYLAQLKPDLVFFDFAHWLPGLARKHGAKSVYYGTSSLVAQAYLSPLTSKPPPSQAPDHAQTKAHDPSIVIPAPPGSQIPDIVLEAGVLRALSTYVSTPNPTPTSGGVSLLERISIAFKECDAIASKACKEMEGPFVDCVEKQHGKPVLLAGPLVPDPPSSALDHRLQSWLNGFSEGEVVYCALGSECTLPKNQFQELLLGLELTGKPFLAALKPPTECETIEGALPEGFLERTKGRGIVDGGWVQQLLILQHPSVGCFVTHSGPGSIAEAMLCKCQLVLLPQAVDQFIVAQILSLYWRVGFEVEKTTGNDGCFTKEAVCKAILTMMDTESSLGKETRANHARWRDLLSKDGLLDSYIDEFVQRLQQLLTA